MNYIWPLMIISAILISIVSGRVDETILAGLEGAKSSVMTVLSFAGMMCFWSGILSLADKSGITSGLEKLLRPITHILFPRLKKGSEALKKITSNIAANLLGMGNAATPAGIDAMCELDRINQGKDTPSDEMCIFTVLNTASLQLIPTTLISLRAAACAQNPSDILIPVWICSALSLVSSIFAMKIILFLSKKRRKK